MPEVGVGIDVVFPIGSMNWVPYLKNACNGIRRQAYNQHRVGIVVSYLYSDKGESIENLAAVCKENNAVLTIGSGKGDAFETPLCRNMGALRTARKFVAFIDCDVVLERKTFSVASMFLTEKRGVIVPVADLDLSPDATFFEQVHGKAEWDNVVTSKGRNRPDALGVIIVPRWAAFSIRGYDERMCGWGADDTDFVMRMRRYGIEMLQLKDYGCSSAIHQQHSTSARESKFTAQNRRILAMSQHVVRNDGSWGGVNDADSDLKRVTA